MIEPRRPDLALFIATSGHSGVDRIVANLLPEFTAAGLCVDLLQVRGHGPSVTLPAGVRGIDLGTRHVGTSLWPLWRYLRRHRPRVLLSDKDRANRTALTALRLARVDTRCVLRLGTTVSVNLAARSRLEGWRQRRSLKQYTRADAVIVPSEGAADDLAQVSGLARDRIRVLANPIVTAALQGTHGGPAPHPWFEADAPVIVGIGSLTARKDYATLMRAFALIRARRACRLILLGDGDRRAELVTLANELGIGEDVHMPGFMTDPYAWLAHAAVFAHSSRWEGLGIALVEALALGIPVVATDCPSGPAEVLDHGRHGRLVPVGDAEALAEALSRTLDAPPDRAALRHAAGRFRADVAARAYMDVLGLTGRTTQPVNE